jgi:guanylate kinase
MQTVGKSIVFSAPSGSGKSTIINHLLKVFPELCFSVSACSRAMRPGEVEGINYYFLGIPGFKEKIAQDAFFEWEEVYANHYYGTLNSELQRIWQAGKVVIFDVDVAGGLRIKEKLGDNALSCFIKVNDLSEIEKRLRERGTESEENLQARLEKAKHEFAFQENFDVIIYNHVKEEAFAAAEKHVRAFLEKK